MRLVDADELRNDLLCALCGTGYQSEALYCVDRAETIDPVHAAGVCYCRECKWRIGEDEFGEGFCSNPSGIDDRVLLNDFCSYGERKNENEV